MCGIAGVISWSEKYRTSPEMLGQMSSRIAHRGPDGEGIHFSAQVDITPIRPQVALAHRRLAILDPDPRANQPFTDHAKRWMVYNGEIYNFRDLRAELSQLQPTYEWRTTGDTEVLLMAYDQWGEKCVTHLNGMFAFAIWDEPQQKLILARDRMGQKPLYVAGVDENGTSTFFPVNQDSRVWTAKPLKMAAIAFASEICAITVLPWVNREIHSGALVEYLRLGYVPHRQSIYQGVGQVAAGETVVITCECSGVNAYFDAARGRAVPPDPTPARHDPASVSRTLVQQAVRRQLVSDVPVGCFLSGGVDSSIIAACMRASVSADQQVHTFSIGFDDARYDESTFAAAVAKHLGTTHHRFKVCPNAAVDLPLLASVFGQPFGDSSALPTHYLARETRSHVKVALSGDGGDELFGGYDRYRAMLLASRLRAATSPVPWKYLSTLLSRLPPGSPKSRWNRLHRFVLGLQLPAAERYAHYTRIFSDEMITAMFANPPARVDFDSPILPAQYDLLLEDHDVVQAALAVDRGIYLPDDLLTKVDRASMLHALEVRAPFMDHDLVQFAAGLTTHQLLQPAPKRMLREAFATDLPSWVFKRKKMGFAVPIGDWFRGELREMLHDHLFASDSFASKYFNQILLKKLVHQHETRRNDHSQRLYALLMLELWWKQQ